MSQSLNELTEQIVMAVGVRHCAPVPISCVSKALQALEHLLQCGQINLKEMYDTCSAGPTSGCNLLRLVRLLVM